MDGRLGLLSLRMKIRSLFYWVYDICRVKLQRQSWTLFLSILDDVNQRCASLTPKSSDTDKRVEIMRKIKSTMSDRVATEISFKELLHTYKSDLMKDHVENFDNMSPEEQHLITRMFNFFCGLHLLVNIAELMDSIFKKWESSQLGTESTESGILRTVRNVSKAFEPGADNKNGASLEFITYVKRKGVHNLQIKSFLGNRFNIVFHNGGVIYCLRDYIVSFLRDVKSEGKTSSLNWLLGSILSDLNNDEYVVGLRALGIVNKFITAPLWKLLECKTTHILDMNEYYQDLVLYLESVATDTEKTRELLTGEYIPFSVEVKKDAVWVALVSQSDNDALTVSILMQMCAGMCKLIKEKVKDHLDQGVFHDMNEQRDELKSVLPHNKLPEWVFGYLDWMLKHIPNATRIANEAHKVFQVNKTGLWLRQKSNEEVEKLMDWTKKILPNIVQKEKQRIQHLNEELEKISREKEARAREKKEKERRERERLTASILQDGLWKTQEEMNRRLQGCSKKVAKEKVKNQIKFRQHVLLQEANKELFLLTRCAGRVLTVEMLQENLCILMDMANVGGNALLNEGPTGMIEE